MTVAKRVGEPRSRAIAGALLCAALAVVVFLPTFNFRFVNWDDDFHVYRSPVVTADREAGLGDALLTPHLGYPVPVTVATYRVEHAVYGIAPAGYHVTNVLLHALTTVLVFCLALSARLRLLGAVTAAMLFAIHPAVAEPVSWISGRKDLLATLFAVAALLAHLWRPFRIRQPVTYLGTVLFVLAVFSKPSVVLVPVIAALGDRVFNRASWRGAAGGALPMAIVTAIAVVLGAVGQSRVGALADTGGLWAWLRTLWYALGHQASVLTLTTRPTANYVVAEMPPAFSPLVDLMPLAVIAFAVVSLVALRERRGLMRFGWALAALAYVPSSGVVPPVRFVADSYLYLVLVGLGLVVGGALERLGEHGRRPRLMAWRWYAEGGRLGDALAQYLDCADRFGRELVAKNVGIILLQMGKRDQARTILDEAAGYAPNDPVIRRYLNELSVSGAPD